MVWVEAEWHHVRCCSLYDRRMLVVCQVVPDATSLHHLREKWVELKWAPAEQNLHSYFVKAYGPEHLAPFKVHSHTRPPPP